MREYLVTVSDLDYPEKHYWHITGKALQWILIRFKFWPRRACPASPAGLLQFIFPSGRPDGPLTGSYYCRKIYRLTILNPRTGFIIQFGLMDINALLIPAWWRPSGWLCLSGGQTGRTGQHAGSTRIVIREGNIFFYNNETSTMFCPSIIPGSIHDRLEPIQDGDQLQRVKDWEVSLVLPRPITS